MPSLDVRHERIVVETDMYRVEGDIALSYGGYRNALTDHLNNSNEEFIFLVNVEMVMLDGSGRSWSAPSLMLAKRFIRSVAQKGLPEKE
jgi:hypothetical protein